MAASQIEVRVVVVVDDGRTGRKTFEVEKTVTGGTVPAYHWDTVAREIEGQVADLKAAVIGTFGSPSEDVS